MKRYHHQDHHKMDGIHRLMQVGNQEMRLGATHKNVVHTVLHLIEHAANQLMMLIKKTKCQCIHSQNQKRRRKNLLHKHLMLKMVRKRKAHIKSHHFQLNKDGTHRPTPVRSQEMELNATHKNVVHTVLHPIEPAANQLM